uniref:Uncharacterized protein LOC113799715 n=1 Tax=Dermatophagoides pteronyssinus TaxID=6956 RepID=A0A6P6YLY8_DERPT|nr:uncharacterized protein LOC113799715 [Dermatophagoides pteronyssinus]
MPRIQPKFNNFIQKKNSSTLLSTTTLSSTASSLTVNDNHNNHINNNNNNNNNRKVQFDSATIAYQVKYSKHPGDDLEKNSKQTKKESKMKMYPRNRIDMIRWFLIQQITIKQWLQFITFILLMIQCFWQCFRLYKIYKKEYKQTSISYELPEQIEFPALTICIPIIIPFNSRCFDDTNSIISGNNGTNDDKQNRIECLQTPLTMLFNQSMSTFGHQCKIKTNRSSPSMIYCANISPIIENYYQNYRCYTYLSEITLFRSNNDQLMIPILEHNDFYVQILIQSNQFDEIPIDSLKEFLTISMGRIYNINFNLPIDCNHQCPKDCQKTDVELEVKEIENEDQGETMITIRRSIRPDKLLIQIPSISSVQYIGYIGGLLAFHLAIWWLICKFFELIEFIWEVYQLNCV